MDAQGTQTHAKEDTVYLSLDSGITTDLSQFGLDLTAAPGGANGAYRNSDPNRQITGATGRDLYVRVPIDPGVDVDRVLLACGEYDDKPGATYVIELNGSGLLVCASNDTVHFSQSLTAASSGLQDFSISWSTRPNPNTTGAADALISECRIYAHSDTLIICIEQFTHPVGPTNGDTFMVGGYGNQIAWNNASRAVVAARVGRAWHPSAEHHEEWISSRATAPIDRLQNYPVLGPYDPAAGFGNENEWIGAANAGIVKRISQTTLSATRYMPLVNEVYRAPKTFFATYASNPSPQWLLAANDNAAYRLDVTSLRYVMMPHGEGLRAASDTESPYTVGIESGYPALRCRVHVKSWVTSGPEIKIGVRLYAMTRPPYWFTSHETAKPTPAFAQRFSTILLTVDHATLGTEGEWLEFDALWVDDLVNKAEPWTHSLFLCLAVAIDPLGEVADDTPARVKINAWQVRPAWSARWEVQA